MQRIISRLHQGLVLIFSVGLLVQIYLAGAPMFGVTTFQPHRMLGTVLVVLAILIPVLALLGRLERQTIGLSLLLAVLAIVQGVLPALRVAVPWLAALHSINALALIGISIRIGRRRRAEALPVRPGVNTVSILNP